MKWVQWLFGVNGRGEEWSRNMMEDISAALLGLPTRGRSRDHTLKR